MASGPSLLQQSWALGERRDRSKDLVGTNAAWKLTDWVPDRKGSPLERRGGWEKKGTWGTGLGNISYINAGIFAPMNGGEFIIAVDEDGAVWRVTPGGATWNIDASTRNVGLLKQNPIFYFDDIIYPSFNGTQTMSRSNETTTSEYTFQTALPAGEKTTYLTQWKNRMIGAVNEKIYFGPPGDPNQAWDVASVYVQTQPIRGLWTVRAATLIFYKDRVEIMRGTVPAGYNVTDDDIRFDSLFDDIGLYDAFSLCAWNDGVCWADLNGVYWTDGAAATDLTDLVGLRERYREVIDSRLADFNSGLIRIAAGVYADRLHVTFSKPSTSAYYETFVIDIPDRVAWEYSNLPFACYINSNFELFAGGIQASGLVGEISHIYTENNPTDEFTVALAVLPVMESGYYRFSQGASRIVDVYLGYALEGAASQSLLVQFTTDPHPGTPANPAFADYNDGDEYLSAVDLHGATAEGYHYRRIPVRLEGAGLAIKVSQLNSSTRTAIHNVSISVIPREGWEQV